MAIFNDKKDKRNMKFFYAHCVARNEHKDSIFLLLRVFPLNYEGHIPVFCWGFDVIFQLMLFYSAAALLGNHEKAISYIYDVIYSRTQFCAILRFYDKR